MTTPTQPASSPGPGSTLSGTNGQTTSPTTPTSTALSNDSQPLKPRRLDIGLLIGEPEVLILDEPANGLDPAGIRWMRDLIRDYADRGGTVLLSSHLLHEIEVLADDLVVIGNGRIVAQGAKSQLLRPAGSILRTGQRQLIARALIDAGVSSSPVGEDGLLAAADTTRVGTIAFAVGIPLIELRPDDGASLEEIFLQLTGETQRDTATDNQRANGHQPEGAIT